MRNGRFVKRAVRVLFSLLLAAALMFAMTPAKAAYAAGPVTVSETNVKLQENCTAVFDGNKLTVTDTDDNNDVWSSKLLLDAGMELTAGEQYKISFDLTGENGVGEFFLCKGENIDERYDETFASEAGEHTVTFTAEDTALFFGIQCGNLGNGNSVTVSNISVTPVEGTGNRMMMAAASQEGEAPAEEGITEEPAEGPAEEPVEGSNEEPVEEGEQGTDGE